MTFCASRTDDDPSWNTLAIRLNGVLVTDRDRVGALADRMHQKRGVGLRGHVALQIRKNHQLRMRFGDLEIAEVRSRWDWARASQVACGPRRATTSRLVRR